MKKEIWLGLAVAVMFGMIGVFFGIGRFQPEPPATGAGSNLLAQTLLDAQGKSEPLSKWKGKTVVANFWATWCPPCIEEMPELSQLQMQAHAHNIQVIGIGIDSLENIRDFSAKHKISYPLYIAGTEGLALSRQAGNVRGGLPFTIVIGADGQIKQSYLGRLDMKVLRKDLGLI